AHSLVIIDVVSHVQNRKKCAIAGWKSTPRCAMLRCRYSVTEKMVSWVATSRYSASVPQLAWSRPWDRNWRNDAGIADSEKGMTPNGRHQSQIDAVDASGSGPRASCQLHPPCAPVWARRVQPGRDIVTVLRPRTPSLSQMNGPIHHVPWALAGSGGARGARG